MIVVTGAYGFIGSCLIGHLNEVGYHDIVAVDDFSKTEKKKNLDGKKIAQFIERSVFNDWLATTQEDVRFVFHIGARTDTTEFDYQLLTELNLEYTKQVWNTCVQRQIPLIYASSAATYGLGELGYVDSHAVVADLKPLNPYGWSKNEFDKWALTQTKFPPFWAGVKFFNVYGPNEYHKGRMASVVFHFFNQIQSKGGVSLFRSHDPAYADGEQMRDFIYVKDVLKVLYFLMSNSNKVESGLYNLGTGNAETFNNLVAGVFEVLGATPNVTYIDTPADIRDKYQYFTEADMTKLLEAGYKGGFHSLREGIKDYVLNYLSVNHYF